MPRGWSADQDLKMLRVLAERGPWRTQAAMGKAGGVSSRTAFLRVMELILLGDARALDAMEQWNAKTLANGEGGRAITAVMAELLVQQMHEGVGTAPLLLRIAKQRGVATASETSFIADNVYSTEKQTGPKKRGRKPKRPRPEDVKPLAGDLAKRPAPADALPPTVTTSLTRPLLEGDYNALGESVCHRCKSNLDEGDILVCDGCDLEFHRKCLRDPLAGVPQHEWFCEDCIKKKIESDPPRAFATSE
jgi:hypothetical protein